MSLSHTRILRSLNVHLSRMRKDPVYRKEMEELRDMLTEVFNAPLPETQVIALPRISMPSFNLMKSKKE